MSALWSLMSPRAVIGRERGAAIELVPLLWNSHSCDCLRCSDHVDLCRIECDNGTMPYAHRPMPELEGWRWLGPLPPEPLRCFGEASGISGHRSC